MKWLDQPVWIRVLVYVALGYICGLCLRGIW